MSRKTKVADTSDAPVPPPPPKKRQYTYRPRTEAPSEHELDAMDDEQRYQAEYYRDHAKKRSKARAKKWREDADYRAREINRMRERRAAERKRRGADKFEQMVAERREEEADNSKPHRRARIVTVGKQRVWVWGTSKLAAAVGKTEATIRAWLASGVLPGCSVWMGRRGGQRARPHFSKAFIAAVEDACRQLYVEAGRGDLDVLRRLVLYSLSEHGLVYQANLDGPFIRAVSRAG